MVMRTTRLTQSSLDVLPHDMRESLSRRMKDLIGIGLVAIAAALGLAFASWSVRDPSLSHATAGKAQNLLGYPGAIVADLGMQLFGIAAAAITIAIALIGARLLWLREEERFRFRIVLGLAGLVSASGFAAALPVAESWPLPTGLGGAIGDQILAVTGWIGLGAQGFGRLVAGLLFGLGAIVSFSLLIRGLGDAPATDQVEPDEAHDDEPSLAILAVGAILHFGYMLRGLWRRVAARLAR
ncbi:MAG: DNA translocase FtsK 4TM domain-containing protein, partial [Hyphomicrobiales bacterium]|nr:DNA translocase FtsK 4TM domain-containing protein [Hyphomicrobiales bacterium]